MAKSLEMDWPTAAMAKVSAQEGATVSERVLGLALGVLNPSKNSITSLPPIRGRLQSTFTRYLS